MYKVPTTDSLRSACRKHSSNIDFGKTTELARGNPGDIGRAKKRQRRKWFNTKYYASVMNIKEFNEENLGWEFCGIISNALNKKIFSQNHL